MATKIWAKRESGLTTVWLKWDPPVYLYKCYTCFCTWYQIIYMPPEVVGVTFSLYINKPLPYNIWAFPSALLNACIVLLNIAISFIYYAFYPFCKCKIIKQKGVLLIGEIEVFYLVIGYRQCRVYNWFLEVSGSSSKVSLPAYTFFTL